MTLHFTQIFFTDARTFIARLPFSAHREQHAVTQNLFVAVHNSSAVQVVGTQLNGYAVTRQNADEVFAHSSRDVRQNFVVRLELYLEHGVGQRLDDRCHDLNRVFLRQTVSTSGCFRTLAFWTEFLTYSVRTFAPVSVTATVCSK